MTCSSGSRDEGHAWVVDFERHGWVYIPSMRGAKYVSVRSGAIMETVEQDDWSCFAFYTGG